MPVIAHTLTHGFDEGIKIALAPLITGFPIILLSLLLLTRLSRFDHVLAVFSLAAWPLWLPESLGSILSQE